MNSHKEFQYIVIANGFQAPYRIGERIESFACTFRGLEKAKKLAMKWTKPATIVIKTPIGRGYLNDDYVEDIDHDRIKQTYNIG